MNQIILSAIISSIITILSICYIHNRTSDNYYISPIVDENTVKKEIKEMTRFTILGFIGIFVSMLILQSFV